MVETITPVVHGGRRSRWGVVLALHVMGAVAAAAAFGAALAGVGSLLGAPWGAAGVGVVGGLAALYLAREALGVPVPVPQLRRQVPDWWRTFFSFGPAAFLYGMGLGIGFLTFLAHGTLVVVSAAAVVSGRPLLGAALLAPFGLARGLSALVAGRVRTAEEGTALVGRLARSASWIGWRIAHASVLSLVLVAGVAAITRIDGIGEPGGVAAATLAVAFGAAGVSKIARARAWRRALASYRLPVPIERSTVIGVPLLELGLVSLPLLGLASTAGAASLVLLGAFSAAIVVGRVRVGRRLDCGCFGASARRDYRVLLARNGVLALVAIVAWREGSDALVSGSLGAPGGADLVPAALVALGLALAAWVGVTAVATLRRGADR